MENFVANHIKAVLIIAGLISMILTAAGIHGFDLLWRHFQRAQLKRNLNKVEWHKLIVAICFSASLFICPARSAPITDVVIQQWRYDPQSQTVTVPIVNNSKHAVTAFNLSLKVTSNGTISEYQTSRDFIGNDLQQERYHDKEAFVATSIQPGATYTERIAVPVDFENITVTLDMVAFSDRTAEASNVAALDRLIEQRKAIAASIEKVNGQTADQVRKAKENWKAQEHAAQTEDEGQYIIIEQELNQTPAESRKDYWAWKQKEKAIWLEQSQLRLVGGRP